MNPTNDELRQWYKELKTAWDEQRKNDPVADDFMDMTMSDIRFLYTAIRKTKLDARIDQLMRVPATSASCTCQTCKVISDQIRRLKQQRQALDNPDKDKETNHG